MFQLKWLWRSMEPKYRRLFVTGMVLSAVTCLMLLINPSLTKELVDEVIEKGNREPLLRLLGIMLAVTAVRLTLRYLMVVCLELASQDSVCSLRRRLFDVLMYQEIAFFNRNRTGDLMTRMTGDLDWCRHFIAWISFNTIDAVVTFLSTLILFFTVDWKLTLTMLAVTPVLLVTTKIHSNKIRPKFGAMRERLAEMNTAAQENIAGNRVVRAFAREEYEKQRFTEKNRAFFDAHLAINRQWMKFFPWLEGLANSMSLIAIFAGALFIILGSDLTLGSLSIFINLSWAMVMPMRNIGPLVNDIQRVTASASKVMEVYYARPLIVDRPTAVERPEPQGKIVFEQVHFSFGHKKVLKDISFEVLPGQTLAIIGPTGSGKSVLIQLLARFYDVQSGKILVDDWDVRDWKLQQLRSAVAPATQDVFLFSDTVEGNIIFGNEELTMEQTAKFAHMAAADEFVDAMPEQYNTIIGERGVGLSGGQRQRVALARALAMQAAVLVLDDTTSALDLETERYIQEQLRELTCTKIIIAQRISSVKDADLILVIEDGRITERGRHEELLQSRGYYWETHCLQNDGVHSESYQTRWVR
ncbi:MAG: ABC transporter ATP-binding protein/permease [Oscillospiraceae bacterium]|nr:ABC transporter ATP-binding protein/permease [Oscillospiraceae bacterium]